MANWRLAKSLQKLREQINLAYPNRLKVSDGSIGDAAHSSRTSDHNPDSQGRVCAIDVTHDPQTGPDGRTLSQSLITDPRMKYVIFAGKIFKARTGKWETYRGANPHNHHFHVSVKANLADDDRPWNIAPAGGQPARGTRPTLKRGDRGQDVRLVQEKLSIPVDGVFGGKTFDAVLKFQKLQGLEPDGVVGSNTWKALDLN